MPPHSARFTGVFFVVMCAFGPSSLGQNVMPRIAPGIASRCERANMVVWIGLRPIRRPVVAGRSSRRIEPLKLVRIPADLGEVVSVRFVDLRGREVVNLRALTLHSDRTIPLNSLERKPSPGVYGLVVASASHRKSWRTTVLIEPSE